MVTLLKSNGFVRIETFVGNSNDGSNLSNVQQTIRNFLRTYIHNIIGHYNPSVRLLTPLTYVVCVNFIHEWRYVQFKDDSE